MHYTDLGNRLRAAREAKGLRQEDVAQACDVTQAAVQKWEAGAAAPRGLQRTAKLAEILGIEPADIRPLPSYGGMRPSAATLTLEEPRPPLYTGSELMRRIREKRHEQIAQHLPDSLRQNIDQSIDIKGTKYVFQYLSRRVVASIIHLPNDNGRPSIMSFRMVLYKHFVATRHYNDYPANDRHYLVAMLSSDGQRIDIPRACMNEARMFDIQLESFDNIAQACQHIVTLEKTTTDLEHLAEAGRSDDWFE